MTPPRLPGQVDTQRLVAAVAALASLTGCGSAASERATVRTYDIRIVRASFPRSQRLGQRSVLAIVVRNVARSAVPDVAVTITDPRLGTSVQAFSYYLHGGNLASHSRPVWVVNAAPGPCRFSCQAGGPGGTATSYSNTWALGRLAPGASATFRWTVTAVQPGSYRLRYAVSGGLGEGERAVLPNGRTAAGTFAPRITSAPPRTYINDSGRIVTSS